MCIQFHSLRMTNPYGRLNETRNWKKDEKKTEKLSVAIWKRLADFKSISAFFFPRFIPTSLFHWNGELHSNISCRLVLLALKSIMTTPWITTLWRLEWSLEIDALCVFITVRQKMLDWRICGINTMNNLKHMITKRWHASNYHQARRLTGKIYSILQ